MADNQIGYQYRNDGALFLFDYKGLFFFTLLLFIAQLLNLNTNAGCEYFQYNNLTWNLKLYCRTFNRYLSDDEKKSSLK